MINEMFCMQCEEAQKGDACLKTGTCGKRTPLSARIDLLMFMIKGLSVVADTLAQHNKKVDIRTSHLITESLYASMTNVNFDDLDIERRIIACMELRYEMIQMAHIEQVPMPTIDVVQWFGLPIDFADKAQQVSIEEEQDLEQRAYREWVIYGLKGMAAYLYHAINLKRDDPSIHRFICHTLSRITQEKLSETAWNSLILKVGEYGLRTLALLDNAHIGNLGNPTLQEVTTRPRQRPGILVSGHDMSDLLDLLEQCEKAGVDVYTHCEMLPAHYYPRLRHYHCLAGHYGGSWWQQHRDFEAFGGPILMTSNCLVPLYQNESYQHKLFTTGAVGYPSARHIVADTSGHKDFSLMIDVALRSNPPEALRYSTISGGYAHQTLSHHLETMSDYFHRGMIKHFAIIAGCDGRMNYRNYYTELVHNFPPETIFLTAGCTKYRFIGEDLGYIGTIPRILDAGQCNDTYSLILFTNMLRDALKLNHLREVPISFHLAWYEQKSIILMFTLLYLGIPFRLGPTFPAFLSPSMRLLLREKFSIHGITTPNGDVFTILRDSSSNT